ncbi:hypothetical protein DES41_10548 [Pseudorhodoferax soli]|uniref:Uncharacterized protein n=1 Tax=Pseudorhodoferax soli TaxID=545864 RepID=A0A368XQ23_9BURK|nr:hypothetical protein DES41_10548 [Pseudorhodoferax soli]
MKSLAITQGPLELTGEPPPSFGSTYRDFVVLLWLETTPDGWECAGIAHTALCDHNMTFRMQRVHGERRDAIDAAMAQAGRAIDVWYADRGQ